MSTKIYNAFKVNDRKKLLSKIREVRPDIRKYFKDVFLKQVEVSDWEDMERFFHYNKKGSPSFNASTIDIERILNCFSLIAQPTVVLFYDGDDMYVQFFGFNQKIITDLWKNGAMSDFHYQNQTDPEVKGMTDEEAEKEYERRSTVWERIYEGTGWAPSEGGFVQKMLTWDDTYDMASAFCKKGEELYEEFEGSGNNADVVSE